MVGMLVGPFLWAGAVFTIWGVTVEMGKLWSEFEEWAIRHDEPPAAPLRDGDPMETPCLPAYRNADAELVRAVFGDADLEAHYPWLTAEQRRDILQRRRQETR